ncbi:two-component regulator propeller domain-containing protein [Mariniflexile litorale]|uniref:histidine kinase n=1 Tax=Mariniflexile litorale TaxID=3045158 RepID=A0AAU7EFC6_9FLAO|nr:two-component regulator propeller domain-containing protein [Mariniflexile sp. KMM 9835]MDQ8210680.1 two-component regulator propeller domain-containing protein [Mariniflexile sp. KMM 9835]
MPKNHLLIIYLFILNILGTFCYAQNVNSNTSINETNNLKFESFNVESGLSNNIITGLAQDSLGYIWVSTVDGLNRYNGNEFLTFKKDNDLENSLNYNFILDIKFNNKGNLMIVTGFGLNIYNPKSESFDLIDQSKALISNSLSCLEFGKQNELIFGVYGNGLQFHNPDQPHKGITLRHHSNDKNTISSNNISDIKLQGKNTVWVSTFDNGLNKIDYTTKKVERILLGNHLDQEINNISCLFLDKDDNLWIGTKAGIIILTKENEKLHLSSNTNKNNKLSDNEILSFEEDDFGNVWVGTQNGGLNIVNLNLYRLNKKAIKTYMPNQNGNDLLSATISVIMKDKDGSMWIGTNHGLNYVNPKENPVRLLQKEFSKDPNSVSDDKIRALAERFNGNIWVGTDGGGLNLYNPTQESYKYFKHIENNPSSLSNNHVSAVLEDSKKRVWVGTYRGGLNLLDTLRGTTKKYLQGSVENGYKVNVIFEDTHKNIWVGTNRGGLYRYVESHDAFKYISILGKMDIRDITQDEYGYLWMATYGNGIFKYNEKKASFDFYDMGNTKGMPGNITFAIEQLPDKNFLIGSAYGGLIKLFPDKREITNYTDKDGLSNNTINSMVFRDENEIWLGTYKGLSYFNYKTGTIKNLSSFDNISQSDFNVGASLKTKEGTLYFGSNNGLYIIDPNKIFSSKTNYPLIFENLKLFNDKVGITSNSSKGILNKTLPYIDHIELDHNQTLITIDFSILKYPSAHNIKYSYLLEGYQDQWININNSNSINLSKLPPGKYKLVVKGIINPEKTVSKTLLITINPPFWKTLPAYITYLILLLGILWIALKYYSERIKLKNSLLFEKKQRQLENELNLERVRFFTSFSHELKTPLSLIIAPVENLIGKIEKKKQKEQLQMVLKNSKYLLKNIQKLLEFRKSELGLNKLSIERINISDYINQILISYKPIAKSRGISLKIDKPENDIYILCDIEKIEIITHNFLSNAFKYSERNGSISVSIKTKNKRLLISVANQGKGVSEQDLPHIFDWYYQSNTTNRKKGSGIGLALSKIFAELHMGTIYVESKLNKETKFTLDIPNDAFLEETNNTNYTPAIENEVQTELNSTAEIWEYQERSSEKDVVKSKIKQDKSRELLLIVDDNTDILQFLSSLLEDEYDLIFAENGSVGIQKAIKYVPDLILSDVMMPVENGIELCKTLKKEQTTSHIPIILLTAKGNPEGITEGYQEGADDYITKPFNSNILKTRIRNLIQNRLKLKDFFSNDKNDSSDFVQNNKSLLDGEKAFLQKFEQVIEALITKGDANTEVICEEMGMSRTSLFRKIKVLTGNNINEFVRKVRLKRAVHLIKNENYTISEASFEVGFNSVKYFRKLIKAEYGTLPSKLND